MENAEPLSGLRQRRPLSSQQSSQQAREERRDRLSALRERETVSKAVGGVTNASDDLKILSAQPEPEVAEPEQEAVPVKIIVYKGDCVEAVGLKSKKGMTLNGLPGTVSGKVKLRYQITFDNKEQANIQAQNLKLIKQDGFKKNDSVVLQGFEDSVGMNGREGVVRSIKSKGEYEVEIKNLENGRVIVVLKTEYLRRDSKDKFDIGDTVSVETTNRIGADVNLSKEAVVLGYDEEEVSEVCFLDSPFVERQRLAFSSGLSSRLGQDAPHAQLAPDLVQLICDKITLKERAVHQEQRYRVQAQHLKKGRAIVPFLREAAVNDQIKKLEEELYRQELANIVSLLPVPSLPENTEQRRDVLEIGSGDGYLLRSIITNSHKGLLDRIVFSEPDVAARIRGGVLNSYLDKDVSVYPLSVEEMIENGHTEDLEMIISCNVLDIMSQEDLKKMFKGLSKGVKKDFKVVHIQQFRQAHNQIKAFLMKNKSALLYLNGHKTSVAVFGSKHKHKVEQYRKTIPTQFSTLLQNEYNPLHQFCIKAVEDGEARSIDTKDLCKYRLKKGLDTGKWNIESEEVFYQVPACGGFSSLHGSVLKSEEMEEGVIAATRVVITRK